MLEAIVTWYEAIRTWANANQGLIALVVAIATIGGFIFVWLLKSRGSLKLVAKFVWIFKRNRKWKYVKDDNGNNLYSKGKFEIRRERYERRLIGSEETDLVWIWVARHNGQIIKRGGELEKLVEHCNNLSKHFP